MASPWREIARTLIYRAPGECERCPACASDQLFDLDVMRLVVDGHRLTGFVSGCDECGLVFSNPQPSVVELERFYAPDGEWQSSGADDAARTTVASPRGSWARPFEPIRGELDVAAPPPHSRVLDFGCGAGRLLDALQDCGWETWGIEPAVDTAFRRHRRLDVVPHVPTFDLIVANHVLEHVGDPLALLRQFARASRPGGHLFVGVPRLDTLPVHRDYKYVINGRAHVMAFTWPCLHGLLARAGWIPVAPPPDLVAKGGGRTTRARLRVNARLGRAAAAQLSSPGRAARAALRRYHAGTAGRPWLLRAGLYRLAARWAEAARRKRRSDRQHENGF
jgi:SAM-dependent methyltransferase